MSKALRYNTLREVISPRRVTFPTVIAASLLAFSGSVLAGSLDAINFSSLPGDRVEIKMQLSEPVGGEPLSFTIDNPARIAIDLPGQIFAKCFPTATSILASE